MTLIQQITRLDHLGVLRDFRWPEDLHDFARFNLIYGWNGSGKTTLSRLFRQLEHRAVPSIGRATLCINGTHVNGDAFPQTTVPIRVFNRDFVNDSVFPVRGGDVRPIFVVGKENVDNQKRADRAKSEKSLRDAALAQARETVLHAARELDKHCVERARVIKDALRAPGHSPYNEYDKRVYREQMEQMACGDAESHQLDPETRNNLLLQHRETIKPRMLRIEYQLPPVDRLRDEVAATLTKTVVSSALDEVKCDPQLEDWVRDGWNLHKERASQDCLFCDQVLSIDRQAALGAYFNTQYDRLLEHVDALIKRLNDLADEVGKIRPPDSANLYDHVRVDYDSAKLALDQARERLSEFLAALVYSLRRKRDQLFMSLDLDVVVPEIDDHVVARLNEVIQCHNNGCDDFEVKTAGARDRIARDIIVENINDYSRLTNAEKAAKAELGPIQADVQRLSHRIELLEQAIVEHRQPAEELNDDLRKYLGHGELRLGVKDTGYVLMRDGLPADSLSEGETTALALLYFLKSLGDRRFDLTRGVVVLDDPVSSLDANALYLAFGYIRQRTQDAAQLFLFTHNFTFLRLVRNWFHHLQGQNKRHIGHRPARFYMLDQTRGPSARCTTIRRLDPLLEQYESEYHYLFACVYREANAPAMATLEQNYHLPNVARRLLEMFLAFRQPQVAGELWKKLRAVEFDEAAKIRIVRFVHTHSHGDMIGAPEHDPTLLGEAQSVLVELLQFIKSQDPAHYEAMVSVVTPRNELEEGE